MLVVTFKPGYISQSPYKSIVMHITRMVGNSFYPSLCPTFLDQKMRRGTPLGTLSCGSGSLQHAGHLINIIVVDDRKPVQSGRAGGKLMKPCFHCLCGWWLKWLVVFDRLPPAEVDPGPSQPQGPPHDKYCYSDLPKDPHAPTYPYIITHFHSTHTHTHTHTHYTHIYIYIYICMYIIIITITTINI